MVTKRAQQQKKRAQEKQKAQKAQEIAQQEAQRQAQEAEKAAKEAAEEKARKEAEEKAKREAAREAQKEEKAQERARIQAEKQKERDHQKAREKAIREAQERAKRQVDPRRIESSISAVSSSLSGNVRIPPTRPYRLNWGPHLVRLRIASDDMNQAADRHEQANRAGNVTNANANTFSADSLSSGSELDPDDEGSEVSDDLVIQNENEEDRRYREY